MAALKPAACAFRTFFSKVHVPRIISTNGEFVPSPDTALLVSGVQASDGSARCRIPQAPDPLIAGAKVASMSSNDRDMLFPIKTTFACDFPKS
eukprot:Gb_33081 [translate_table: standard]